MGLRIKAQLRLLCVDNGVVPYSIPVTRLYQVENLFCSDRLLRVLSAYPLSEEERQIGAVNSRNTNKTRNAK